MSPRFLHDLDVAYFQQLNKELLGDIIETMVTIYKLEMKDSPSNIYGESIKKAFHVGVQVPCLIKREDRATTSEGFILDTNQSAVFSFLREMLKERAIYPETGDLIEYDSTFYEINAVSENQLLGDQPYLNFSIVCTAHLTKRSAWQLEERRHTPVQGLE